MSPTPDTQTGLVRRFLRTPHGFICALILTGVAVYLVADNSTRVLGALPYLLVFICPIMHLWMMRGMHGQHTSHGHTSPPRAGEPTDPPREP